MPSKVILLQSEGLGTGNDELGEILMSNFLRLLGESQEKPQALVFWNTGVRLVCEGSWALEHLQDLEGRGVEILACRTCLAFCDLGAKLKVGRPSTMPESIQAMFDSDMVCL